MKLVLIGPPGSGKGTVSLKLKEHYNLQHISIGDIIRDHIAQKTSLGIKVQDILNRGELVSDHVMKDLVHETLSSLEKKEQGFLLDGFPRTIVQTKWFMEHFTIDHYIFFTISDATVIERISGRRIEPQSNRIYHITFAPPKVEGIDDINQAPLIHRADDKPDKIKTRLQVYKEQTEPIISYIISHTKRYSYIDAEQNEQKVFETVLRIFSE